MSRVPLVDLAWQHAQIAAEVADGFARVLDATAFVGGPAVARFEERYAAYAGVAHCIGVANGTDALELALRALGVGPGDEVIVPANTFVATALAVVRAGAQPVFVDCDPTYALIDVEAVAARLGPRTRAVIPVHLYGQMALVEALEPLTSDGRVALVEDAAQAQGARRNGRPAGSVGRIAGTSFYPGKNLGAYGDAGAVLTGDAELAHRVRALGNYGGERKYEHESLGFNSRLDALQAVVLDAKLAHLDDWNERRRRAARAYDERLADLTSVELPRVAPGNEHVWHLYVVRVPRRDAVLERLAAAGVGAGIHYPVPLHRSGAFAHLGHRRGDFPVAERLAGEILSLPLHPGLTEDVQDRVVHELRRALAA